MIKLLQDTDDGRLSEKGTKDVGQQVLFVLEFIHDLCKGVYVSEVWNGFTFRPTAYKFGLSRDMEDTEAELGLS